MIIRSNSRSWLRVLSKVMIGLALVIACLSSGSAYGMLQEREQKQLQKHRPFLKGCLMPCQKVDTSKATREEFKECIQCLKSIPREGLSSYDEGVLNGWISYRESWFSETESH